VTVRGEKCLASPRTFGVGKIGEQCRGKWGGPPEGRKEQGGGEN